MIENPCVSIIVPIYNQEKFLHQSIPALINQTHTNLDIVLVNDGSTDSSLDIIRHYADQDPRIQVIDQENGGVMDATLAGIAAAKGDYSCFFDPDDLLGKDFVKLFVDHISEDCDCIAAGFYYENSGTLTPYPLKEDRIYTQEELRKHRDDFLHEGDLPVISNRFFISRWNKMYRTDLVLKIVDELSECKDVSLGDDTLLTYLILTYSKGCRTISQPNGYFYKTDNPNSIAKVDDLRNRWKKCEHAFHRMKALVEKYQTNMSQAYALYYLLVDSTYAHTKKSDPAQYKACSRLLKADALYQTAKHLMRPKRKFSKSYLSYATLTSPFFFHLYQAKQTIFSYGYTLLRRLSFWCKTCINHGPIKATRLTGFQRDRDRAFVEMPRLIAKLDGHIYPILKPFLDEHTDLDACALNKNIFVFWWDGFAHAPHLVQKCLDSVIQHHPGHQVIPIDKENYKQYTDIDSRIVSDFEKAKISIQTFSDILRFNLLKNHGGVWIDATIFFNKPYDLLGDLSQKSFTSLAFCSSKDFLEYDGYTCSWSGYYIASRQNGLFVRAVNRIFDEYYLTYGTYSTYFFIDIVLMLCKKYGLDDNALMKTRQVSNSMFTLSLLLDQPFDDAVLDFIKNTPQKLRWNVDTVNKTNTFYGWLLEQ